MALLYKHLRIHQIFGANTDVGKTVLTTALVRASAARGKSVFYLKPVSTGPSQDADDVFVTRFSGPDQSKIHAKCLFQFAEPVSPHLAAKLQQNTEPKICVPSDDEFANSVANHIRSYAAMAQRPSDMYVESAGGVHSPTLSGTTQLESYRPLLLPTILIGDSRLGGISATISSYESLILRGYTVDSILLFRDEYYRNWEYLQPYFAERGLRVDAVNPPPEKHSSYETNTVLTEDYYAGITSSPGSIQDVVAHLDTYHADRLQNLESMSQRARDVLWWPFVQHGNVTGPKDVTVIDSASEDTFSVYNGHLQSSTDSQRSYLDHHLDGSASWWTQAIGHANSTLTLAAAKAAGRYGHVMYPQAVHEPALTLAERLIKKGPGAGWASRVFYSDDGSTGMEVALKMALRAFAVREAGGLQSGKVEKRRDLGILGLKGSYHGDTIGAMNACEEGVYTSEWHDAKGYWLDPPTIAISSGKVQVQLPSPTSSEHAQEFAFDSLQALYDIQSRLNAPLADIYRQSIEKILVMLRNEGSTIAALVLEPIVMGAGGMIFVDPLYQRILVDTVRGPSPPSPSHDWSGLPIIFDEVFVGLHRLGFESSTSILGVYPDISVNAKILTGGLVPLAVTLATESIFQSFYSSKKTDALLHGHSYTAYPIGCAIANQTLDMVEEITQSHDWQTAMTKWSSGSDKNVFSLWDPQFIGRLSSLNDVLDVMTLGTVLKVTIRDTAEGYGSYSAQTIFEPLKTIAESMESASPIPGGGDYAVHYRTLGNVAYFMLSLNTSPTIIRSLEKKILDTLGGSTD